VKANASWKKLGGSKKLKTGENIFLVADFLETHNTKCDNSAYNSSILLLTPTFKAVFKVEGLVG